MLRFVFFDEFKEAERGPRPLAYLIGKDHIAVGARITLTDNELACEPATVDAAALAIQVQVGRLGRLTLQTCLLPHRDEPYLLALELARHRMMLFLTKLEEWGLSDLPGDHEIMRLFEEARRLFTAALVTHRDSAGTFVKRQSDLAMESLGMAIEASEGLAELAAERNVLARYAAANESDLTVDPDEPTIPLPAEVGCTVDNDQFAEPLQRVLKGTFDFIHCPMRWDEMEREEGKYTFMRTDRWIEWAIRTAQMSVSGGPLLDLASRSVPKWLYIWEHDYKTLRELAYEHIKRVVTRYRKTVTRWTVISGANINAEFFLTPDQMIDLTRLAVLLVRKLQPKCTVLVEINQPFGEHGTHIDRSMSPLHYAEIIREAGIAIDGYALKLQFGDPSPGRSTRDLMQLSAMIDMLSELERPIHITALGAPSEPIAATTISRSESAPARPGAAEDAGYWRNAWSAETQMEWMTRAMLIAMSKPRVESVCWQSLFDSASSKDMAHGGLITAEGRVKPVLKRLSEMMALHRAGRAPTLSAIGMAPEIQGEEVVMGLS